MFTKSPSKLCESCPIKPVPVYHHGQRAETPFEHLHRSNVLKAVPGRNRFYGKGFTKTNMWLLVDWSSWNHWGWRPRLTKVKLRYCENLLKYTDSYVAATIISQLDPGFLNARGLEARRMFGHFRTPKAKNDQGFLLKNSLEVMAQNLGTKW